MFYYYYLIIQMKTFAVKVLIFCMIGSITMAQNYTGSLYSMYERFREKSLSERRIKQKDLLPLIEQLKKNKKFKVELAGKSYEGRNIYSVTVGKGATRILAWSQMHGDEPTATMALFDIFNFLNSSDELDPLRETILKKLSICFIPMLNPDGAERFIRRNAQSIDLNRDALDLQSPEARILKSVKDKFDPEFGFNLHDQNRSTSVGAKQNSAAISMLLPAFNKEKEVNEIRKKGMQVISGIFNDLSLIVPGHIGRYGDEYEPRAFGDNMVKWGVSSILIESGWWKDDLEKQFVRKLNFIALLGAFYSIAEKSYLRNDFTEYFNIPENGSSLLDFIFRNARIIQNGKKYTVDIGINYFEKESLNNSAVFLKGTISEIGDLSTFYGYNELDLTGYTVEPGKIFPEVIKNTDELKRLNAEKLLSEGYTAVHFPAFDPKTDYSCFPLNIIHSKDYEYGVIFENRVPDFIIKNGDKIRYTVVNGFIFDVKISKNFIRNSLILK